MPVTSIARLVAVLSFLLALIVPSVALAVPLALDGSQVGPAVCPDGGNGAGTPVNDLCEAVGPQADRRHCMYGGEVEFDAVSLTNGAIVCVQPFDGVDKVATGNLVLKSLTSIDIDATSKITAKGAGYQTPLCDDGAGPAFAPDAGGRGGCGVRDSAGGGAHFGNGGRGTEDSPPDFPAGYEEDCGGGPNAMLTACTDETNCRNDDAEPTVAGQAFRHSLYDSEFGAAGGDKGCRDGDGFPVDSPASHGIPTGGGGGGRIVLFAANATQTGLIRIEGRVVADGQRGCGAGNDSAGGGAGGTVFIVGDMVDVRETARISAHGGRGGDSQPKCLPCTVDADCNSNPYSQTDPVTTGQQCIAGRCAPCNCTPCTNDGQCDATLGQTCRPLANMPDDTSYCADAAGECTPFDPEDDEAECRGTQNTGTCDDCAGGGGGGIVNVQSRVADIHPSAVFDVRGAKGGICPVCAGEAGGGAGELQIDSAYAGEICDGFDNDFDGLDDEGLPDITCPDGTTIPACVDGVPQLCDYALQANVDACEIPATDARPRFALIVDTSGSMLNDLEGFPTFGDGSVDHPGVDTGVDPEDDDGDDSRLFIAKEALAQVLSSFPESDYALARYYQDVGVNRSCQTASNFECASSCCSYDDPRDNEEPAYPRTYPDNYCILDRLYPGADYPNVSGFTDNLNLGWAPEIDEDPATSACINYAGSCGPPRRGAQYLVGFDEPITRYLDWLDGVEDDDASFDATTTEGDHCPGGNCELRGTGPTPLGNALLATSDFLTPTIACDGARECRSYSTILLTDGLESCDGDPVGAAADLLAGASGKPVRTFVIGFSVLQTEQTSLNAIALAGGTEAAIFVDDRDELADALAQIIGQDQRFELCNDLDDDCDDLVDEDFPEKGEACDDGELGVCLGTGTFVCSADGLGTTCSIDVPGLEPSAEICNDLDDDCDGFVDEGDDGQPLDCSSCTPMPEVCNGVDDDCDLAIDEEDDVVANQPADYGIACGELTAPHDQSPCSLGVVRCINGGPICVGFKPPCGGGETPCEICNGVDDDCDGVADVDAECPAEGQQCVEAQCAFPCASGEFPCPTGFTCEDGFCLRQDCEETGCPDGEVCQGGVCRPEGGAGGGDPGAGGAPGQGGGAPSGGGDGGSGAAPPAGPGVTASTSGSAGASGDAYGLATGGGGVSCAVGPARGGGWPSLALAALGLAALARRARRSAGGAR